MLLLTEPSGNTARLIAKYRPVCPIIMVTRNDRASRVSEVLKLSDLSLTLESVFASLQRCLPVLFRGREAGLQDYTLARRRRSSPKMGHHEWYQTGYLGTRRHGRVCSRLAWRNGPHQHTPHCARRARPWPR